MAFVLSRLQMSMLNAPSLVGFKAFPVKNAKLLWREEDISSFSDGVIRSEADFVKQFAYVTSTSGVDEAYFDNDRPAATLLAERYGGIGIGRHGGGARTGNIGRYQIKGVGRNPLAFPSGETFIDQIHYTGVLCLADALHEIVSAQIVNAALPNGAVSCLGLIMTSPTAALYPPRGDGRASPAVILVRDQCIRPAHFLPNAGFPLPPKLLFSHGGEAERLRNLTKVTVGRMGSKSNYIEMLRHYSQRAAHQFSAARLIRMCHGAISPSNMTIDGRWVDTAASSILPFKSDYAAAKWMTCYSNEWKAPRMVLSEWVYNFQKYAAAPHLGFGLCDEYDKLYTRYLQIETNKIIGLRTLRQSDALGRMATLFDDTVNQKLTLTNTLSQFAGPPTEDSAVALLRSIYRIEHGLDEANLKLSISALKIIKQYLALEKTSQSQWCMRRSFSRSIKPYIYAQLFSRGRVMAECSSIVLSGQYESITDLVRRYRQAALWVFSEKDEDEDTLLDFNGIIIKHSSYNCVTVQLDNKTQVIRGDNRYIDTKNLISENYTRRLTIPAINAYPSWPRFDFWPSLELLLTELSYHERSG